MRRVFMGYDTNEDIAYKVAEHSCKSKASVPVEFYPLVREELQSQGLLYRPVDKRGSGYDLVSSSPSSTDFSISRFLTPILGRSGFVLFVDCDVVFLDDVEKLFHYADPFYAVQVVRHVYTPSTDSKMMGQVQTSYPKKNWSSVMLFNCDHPANRRLTVHDINYRTGKELHQFYWLSPTEIGSLPLEWNWLVGEQVPPKYPKLAHFTLGGPWFKDWLEQPHDNIWLQAQKEYLQSLPK